MIVNKLFDNVLTKFTWIPPHEDNKFNVDVSSFNNLERSGLGGILRNINGDWLLGFSNFIEISTSLCAKLHAILNSFKIAQVKGFKNIIIKSNFILVVDLTSRKTSQLHA